MQPVHIPGFQTGLQRNILPNVIADDAFQELDNAYIEEGQVKRRAGLTFLNRLRRVFTATSIGTAGANPTTKNIFTDVTPAIIETNAELEPGSVVVDVDGGNTIFTDQGDGTFAITGAASIGVSANSFVNYATGDISLGFSGAPGGVAVTVAFNYFPSLPVMGIHIRELSTLNQEQTLFFDQTYCYIYSPTTETFSEAPSTVATTWASSDSDFFWATNWRGITPGDRRFFVTNFVSTTANPMRQYEGTVWTDFIPMVSATVTMFTAKILLPYYGRMIALNVYEGPGTAETATNIYNRCRFSQIGDPLDTDAWKEDIFGRGGAIDAPTSEAIVSAKFFKNTLIVYFERSTWQLRYVGEYGLPFIFERIDSEFGCESTFSPVQLEDAILSIGDKAITAATSISSKRIDDKIKNLVFEILNANFGHVRVIGSREFEKELVYWSFTVGDGNSTFPNRVLVFNYAENNWSIFRDNVTFFGSLQSTEGTLWDSTKVSWDDFGTFWSDGRNQSLYPSVVSGNQEGFIHKYNDAGRDDQSLSITAIDRTVSPPLITCPNHNLESGDIVYFENLNFVTTSTGVTLATNLNDRSFQVLWDSTDTFEIYEWNGTDYIKDFLYTPADPTGTYVGGGSIALFPKLNIVTKDFNPFQNIAKQAKFIKGSLIFTTSSSGEVTINTFSDTSLSMQGNLTLTQNTVETNDIAGYDAPGSLLSAHAFFASTTGQFVRLQITWNDVLMNDVTTQENGFSLDSMTLFFRPGGKMVF